MRTDRFASSAARALRPSAWILVSFGPAIAQAEPPLIPPMEPPTACRAITSVMPPACLRPPAPTDHQAPPAQPDKGTQPIDSIICACLSIEDIDAVDAIVLRGREARAAA